VIKSGREGRAYTPKAFAKLIRARYSFRAQVLLECDASSHTFYWGFIPLNPAIHERYTRSDAKSQNAHRNVRAVVGWPGAALWGTESAWRIPLNELFDAKVIVFWEHVFS